MNWLNFSKQSTVANTHHVMNDTTQSEKNKLQAIKNQISLCNTVQRFDSNFIY